MRPGKRIVRVVLKTHGELVRHLGEKPAEVVLPDGATMRDLLREIGTRWGDSLPPHLWDPGGPAFRGPVVFMIDRLPVHGPDVQLRDGQEIHVYKALVGG